MSTGRHGHTVDRDDIVETVTELAATNKTLPGGGVLVKSIADELGFERSTIAPYCRRLAKSNDLKRVWGIGKNGPKMTYLVADGEFSQ